MTRLLPLLILLFCSACCHNPYYCGGDATRQDLSLPALFFKEDPSVRVKEIEEIVAAVEKLYPGKQIRIKQHDEPEPGYDRLPIKWRGMSIFVERLQEAA